VTEWPKVHDWKSCVRVTVPRVRIPPSPQVLPQLAGARPFGGCAPAVFRKAVLARSAVAAVARWRKDDARAARGRGRPAPGGDAYDAARTSATAADRSFSTSSALTRTTR
jgi:hypothetical protein